MDTCEAATELGEDKERPGETTQWRLKSYRLYFAVLYGLEQSDAETSSQGGKPCLFSVERYSRSSGA